MSEEESKVSTASAPQGMSISQFTTDKDKTLDGVWVEVGAGMKIKVARLNNTRYKTCLRGLSKPHVVQLRQNNEAAAQLAEALTREAYAKCILLGWENLLDADGITVIPYSEAKALKLLTDHQDFYDIVESLASEQQLFAEDAEAESEGNS